MSDESHKIYWKYNLDLEIQLYFWGGIKWRGFQILEGFRMES